MVHPVIPKRFSATFPSRAMSTVTWRLTIYCCRPRRKRLDQETLKIADFGQAKKVGEKGKGKEIKAAWKNLFYSRSMSLGLIFGLLCALFWICSQENRHGNVIRKLRLLLYWFDKSSPAKLSLVKKSVPSIQPFISSYIFRNPFPASKLLGTSRLHKVEALANHLGGMGPSHPTKNLSIISEPPESVHQSSADQ